MKSYKTFILSVMLLTAGAYASAQTFLEGAYGGSEFYTSTMGMIRNDRSLFFRSDGTYCSELNKPDWQTRVSGHYTISGKKITLTADKDGKISHASLQNNGGLTYGGTFLMKFATMNRLPAQTLEYKMAISGGGQVTGGYAAGQSQQLLSFDGEGYFSHSRFHGTLVNGSAVAGGQVNSAEGDGTYTIENSQLTLHYKNGHTVQMSFFFIAEEPVIALINGHLYYAAKEGERAESIPASQMLNPASESLAIGKEILEKARLAHGENDLDVVVN